MSTPSESGITQFTPSAVKTIDATQVTSRPKPKPKNKSTSAAVNVTANVLTSTGSGAEEEPHAPENDGPVTTEPGTALLMIRLGIYKCSPSLYLRIRSIGG